MDSQSIKPKPLMSNKSIHKTTKEKHFLQMRRPIAVSPNNTKTYKTLLITEKKVKGKKNTLFTNI